MRKLCKRDEGSSLIELAATLPVLLLLVIGAVDFGRAYFMNIEVSSAAEAGALYGSQNTSDVAGMRAAATLDAADVTGLQATATSGCECSDGSGGSVNCSQAPMCNSNVVNYVEVDTVSTYQPMLPYPGIPASFSLAGKARMRAGQQ